MSLRKPRLLLLVAPPSADGSSVELVALSGAAFQSLPNVAKGQTHQAESRSIAARSTKKPNDSGQSQIQSNARLG